ncbi:MAG: DNA repair protein RecO [Candidatus Magasanikbacteria bacterium]|jgi:DNA repair protein RecO|nr:DNA repair protein RecO [Candidatus Magasanikbacteria bacterium]
MMFTRAVVLARTNHREVDERISLLTEERGKQIVIAKGSKKSTSKNAPHLEPGSVISLGIAPGKQQGYATSVQPEMAFAGYTEAQLLMLKTGMKLLHSLLLENDTHDTVLYKTVVAWIIRIEAVLEEESIWWIDVLMVFLLAHMGYPLKDDSLITIYTQGQIGTDISLEDREAMHAYLHNHAQACTEKAIFDWKQINNWLR